MSVRDLTHSLLNRRSWHQNKLDIRKPAIDMIGASL